MPLLQRLRTLAFHAQSGRCYYCSARMWLSSPDELSLRPKTAAPFQCTAEHLVARVDGGTNSPDNIAAACRLCNERRHKRKSPLQPAIYRTLVRRRVALGKWWPHNPNSAAHRLDQKTTQHA